MSKDIELITFSELIDKLMTINIKLYHCIDREGALAKIENKTEAQINELVELSAKNVRLVQQRSKLKSGIDKKLNQAIADGGTEVLDEVKKYG
jgi:cell division protein FtsB